MPSSYDPFLQAEALGIPVEYRDDLAHDGLWLPDRGVIYLLPGMKAIQERCILAHEIAHAELGHRDSCRRNEVAADKRAAMALIDHDELVSYLRWTSDLPFVCLELQVTMKVLRMYLNVTGLARRGYPAGRGTWLAPMESLSA